MFMVVVPLYIPVSNIQEIRLLYIHWYCQSLLNFGHPSRYVVVIHVALISLISYVVEHIFMCLLSFPIHFLVHFCTLPSCSPFIHHLIILYCSWSSCYRPITHGIYFRLPLWQWMFWTYLKTDLISPLSWTKFCECRRVLLYICIIYVSINQH